MSGDLLRGFSELLDPTYLGVAMLGVLLGTLIGILPGIGPVAGISLLIPFTFQLDGIATIVMLAGVYYGAQYAGSTTSILVNVPGESSSVVTAVDGYQMARQGRAGAALAISAIGSFIAGTFGVLVLMLLGPMLVPVALSFGPREYFGLMVLGLAMAALLAGGAVRKALLGMALGLLIAMIGLDPITARPRFTFGLPQLTSGIDVVPVIVGLFGLSEVLSAAAAKRSGVARKPVPVGRLWFGREDWRRSRGPIARGSVLGFVVGLLPGGGGIVSALMSYGTERMLSKRKDEFGHGAIEGVAGPESANNAASTGAFLPLLTLGLPVNAVMAVIFNALIIQGLQPGPRFLAENGPLFWTFIASMYLGNVVLLVLNLPLVPLWAKIVNVPDRYLLTSVVLFAVVGVYSVRSSVFDLLVMAVAGLLGYLMREAKIPMAPLVLAFVLGPQLEQSFRQALLISANDLGTFVQSPLSASLIGAAVLVLASGLVYPILVRLRRGRRGDRAAELVPVSDDD